MTLTTEQFTALKAVLQAEGWSFAPHSHRGDFYFSKRFESPHLCFHNQDKPGIQVVIYVWDHTKQGFGIGLELEIQGTLMVERTVGLHVYHMKTPEPWSASTAYAEIMLHARLLVELWNHANIVSDQ